MSSDEKDSSSNQIHAHDSFEQDAVSVEIDPIAEKRLLRKIDIRIIPFVLYLYTLSFLDRINIGNAIIQGMSEELDLGRDNRFNTALLFFYITYITLEVPSNMMLKKSKPHIFISGLAFCWGITCMCIGFVNNYAGLLALRLVLGVFEAGVLPALIFLVPMYYRRDEVATRIGIIVTSPVLAGAFGGLLAYAIAGMSGTGGYLGWRWIFIIEGAITAFSALFAPWILVGYPDKTKFLSDQEKTLLKRRRALDHQDCRMDTLNKFALKLILRDPKVWLSGFAFFGLGSTGLAIFQFLPTILQEFGWRGRQAQIMTVPIYMVALVFALANSWLADRFKHRYGFVMLGLIFNTIGYALLLNQQELGLSKHAKYGAAFLVPTGGFMSTYIILSWPSINLGGHWKRAIGAGIQVMIGNLNGPVSSYLFLKKDAPYFKPGFGTCLGLSWFGAVCATLLFLIMWRENRLRDAGKRDYRLNQPEEELNNMGDDHPSFRYAL